MKIAPKRIRGMLYNGGTSQICTLFIAIVLTPQSGIYIHTYTHIYIKLHIHIHTASKLNRKITRWREQETSTDFQKLFWSHHLKWSLHPLKRTHISETEERMNANVSHLQLQPSKLQKPLKWTSLRTVEAAILYPCSHRQHDDNRVRGSSVSLGQISMYCQCGHFPCRGQCTADRIRPNSHHVSPRHV